MRGFHPPVGWGATCLALLGIVAIPAVVHAGVIGALVPAYFYPGTGGPGGAGDGWASMTAAAGQIPLTAIFNPNSGPLPGSPDANYVTAMTNLEAAGGHVIAYIPTGYAATSLTTVENAADLYLNQYRSLINGFFIDEMTNSNSASDLTYYHNLFTHLKGINPAFDIVGNPGSPTDPAYLAPATQGADTLVTYENNDAVHTYSASPPSPWVSGFPAGDFANIVYNQSSAAGMVADLNTAASYNVGSIYVTDQTLPNPYRQLPSYWNQEVAALKSAATPEPATLSIWSFGAVLVWRFRAAGKRRRRKCFAETV